MLCENRNKQTKPKEKQIEIEKYKLLNESLRATKSKIINLLVLTGEAGFGKTFTALKYAKENKLNFKYINTYATPLSFYKLLYENRERDVIIFDDLQSMNEPKIKSLFKAACWESLNDKRIINYHSTSPILQKEGLPESFEFDSSIVLIFNDDVSGFEPIIDRGVQIKFNFSFKEKMQIFESFKTPLNIDQEILDYIKKECNEATINLSLRTLIILSKLKKKNYDFKIFAKEMLKKDIDLDDLITYSKKEWCDETGMSERTYYRHKKRFLKENHWHTDKTDAISNIPLTL